MAGMQGPVVLKRTAFYVPLLRGVMRFDWGLWPLARIAVERGREAALFEDQANVEQVSARRVYVAIPRSSR